VCLFNHAWPGTAQVRRRRPRSRAREVSRASINTRRRVSTTKPRVPDTSPSRLSRLFLVAVRTMRTNDDERFAMKSRRRPSTTTRGRCFTARCFP
jgi:hypothetical protein